MHDQIKIKLPYPVWKITINRKIGFAFTNMANFLFTQDKGFETSKDYEKWVDENGQSALISEMLYYSAKAYCTLNKTKENFTKEKLKKAILLASEEQQQAILTTWKKSETFGATIKKKSQTKRR